MSRGTLCGERYCPDDEFCIRPDSGKPYCVTPCSTNDDCPAHYYCPFCLIFCDGTFGGEPNHCERGCHDNSECGEGEYCGFGGTCEVRPPGCHDKADCPEGADCFAFGATLLAFVEMQKDAGTQARFCRVIRDCAGSSNCSCAQVSADSKCAIATDAGARPGARDAQ